MRGIHPPANLANGSIRAGRWTVTEIRDEAYWDRKYRAGHRSWSGEPNPQLVALGTDLAAGRALDAGCGEGADALWLAGRGWRVTGVDVSAVALARAAG